VTARIEQPQLLFAACVAGLAVCVGALAGLQPALAVGAAFGIAFFLLALVNLNAGLIAFVLVTFLGSAPPLAGPASGLAKIVGAVLAVSVLAKIATGERRTDFFWSEHPALTWFIGAFLAWATLSAVWAEDPGETVFALYRYLLNAALFVIVFEAVRTAQQARWVFAAFALGAAASALYGVAIQPDASGAATSPTAATDLNRLAGTIGDPNQLAAVLVAGLILGIAAAIVAKHRPLARLVLIAAASVCLIGVLLTVSRGGLIALGAALVAAVVFARKRRVLVASLVGLLVVAATAYFLYFAPPAARERIEAADGGSGRTDIWKVGGRMVEANLVAGVGAGNFATSSIHYLLVEPGSIENDTYIVDEPKVAHNIYLEVLAELGVVGLALFISILIGSLVTTGFAAREFARQGNGDMELLARALMVAMVALLAADVFLSDQFSSQLWLVLALGPALLSIARREASRAGGVT
jgi:O-antigen ligase